MSFTADINEIVEENRNGLLGKRPHWKRIRLCEVASILNGAPFESSRFKKDHGTPLIRIRDVVRGRTKTYYDGEFDRVYLVQHGDLLIGMDGDFNCEPWAGEPALLNQRVCKITPDESQYAKQFLRYVLPGYLSAINERTPSVTVKHLSSRTVADIPLPCPPLSEQQQIVAEIEKQFTRLDAGVAALWRVQANLKRYRAAVLKAACEGRLVPTEAELAKAEGRSLPAPRPGTLYVYAIRCDDDSIYIGHTDNLARRWVEHQAGQAADWTKQHKPIQIVHYEEYASRQEAADREKWLKTGYGRKWIKREIAAGRARQAGYETGEQLLARILADRRKHWQGRGKYKEPAAPNTANLPPLPEGWAWATVGQLADIGSGNTPAGITTYLEHVGTIPWFKVGDMNRAGNEQIMQCAESYLSRKTIEALRLRLFPAGTIVFPKRGGAIATNKKRLLESPATTDLNVMGLTPYPCVLGYFRYWFASIDLSSLSDGSNVPQVNNKDIQPLPIPLPPLAEQSRIVAEAERRLSVIEELEATANANLQRATRLRQSVLQRMFGGDT